MDHITTEDVLAARRDLISLSDGIPQPLRNRLARHIIRLDEFLDSVLDEARRGAPFPPPGAN